MVFISHSSTDSDIANALVSQIEEQQIPCWIAPRNIQPGMKYTSEIMIGIKQSNCFALLLSPNSTKSTHVLRELQIATRLADLGQTRILPIVTRKHPLPPEFDYLLSPIQKVDYKQALKWLSQEFKPHKTNITSPTPIEVEQRKEIETNRWNIGGSDIDDLIDDFDFDEL